MFPRRLTAALGAALCVLPATALAHGGRLPLDAWGGFAGDVLRCQRVIARAGAGCAAAAWTARRACREAVLAGGACDEAATNDHIADARRAALDAVDAVCSDRLARDLQFLGTFDLQADLINFCRDWERAADSAVFGPAAAAPCAPAAAAAVTDVFRRALRARRACMDRVAVSPPGDGARPAQLAHATRDHAAAAERAAARLAARCPDFAARYGRTPRAFLDLLGARADCVGAAFYIQDAVVCPDPVCGNGVVEPNEDCDDGNTADGDACPAGCVR